MNLTRVSRRTVLKGSLAVSAATFFAQPLKAAAPPPSAVTPGLIEAARKEGKASFYTALELNTSERLARTFEAKYPGVAIRVERSGAERIYQRIIQEQASRIYAVDVVCSTDPSHFLDWTAKDKDWVEPYVTEDMAKHFPADQRDPNGMHATLCAWLEVIGYNTNLVKPENAPRSYVDLLDPKWQGKIVKGHPGYSGAILTNTYLWVRELGWPFLEKLAQQKVMQLQSAADPPKKVAIGERAVMADGNDYSLEVAKLNNQPVEVVHADGGFAGYSGAVGHLPQSRPIRTLRGCFRVFCSAWKRSRSSSMCLRTAPSMRWRGKRRAARLYRASSCCRPIPN